MILKKKALLAALFMLNVLQADPWDLKKIEEEYQKYSTEEPSFGYTHTMVEFIGGLVDHGKEEEKKERAETVLYVLGNKEFLEKNPSFYLDRERDARLEQELTISAVLQAFDLLEKNTKESYDKNKFLNLIQLERGDGNDEKYSDHLESINTLFQLKLGIDWYGKLSPLNKEINEKTYYWLNGSKRNIYDSIQIAFNLERTKNSYSYQLQILSGKKANIIKIYNWGDDQLNLFSNIMYFIQKEKGKSLKGLKLAGYSKDSKEKTSQTIGKNLTEEFMTAFRDFSNLEFLTLHLADGNEKLLGIETDHIDFPDSLKVFRPYIKKNEFMLWQPTSKDGLRGHQGKTIYHAYDQILELSDNMSKLSLIEIRSKSFQYFINKLHYSNAYPNLKHLSLVGQSINVDELLNAIAKSDTAKNIETITCWYWHLKSLRTFQNFGIFQKLRKIFVISRNESYKIFNEEDIVYLKEIQNTLKDEKILNELRLDMRYDEFKQPRIPVYNEIFGKELTCSILDIKSID